MRYHFSNRQYKVRKGSIIFTILLGFLQLSGQPFTEVCLTNNAFNDRYASYSPNGKRIIFESDERGNWDIFMMDSDGKNRMMVTQSDSADRRPDWHPNGKSILFESSRSGKFELYSLRLKSGEVSLIPLEIDSTAIPIFARYSPNGKKIAASIRYNEHHADIIAFSAQGKLIKKYTEFGLRSFYPSWTPDGKSLVFFSRHETNNELDEIYMFNGENNEISKIISGPTHNFCPVISPDGLRVAFVESQTDKRPEIFVTTLDDSGKIQVTNNDSGDTIPSWSPDGKKLLITAYRNGQFEICEIELEN